MTPGARKFERSTGAVRDLELVSMRISPLRRGRTYFIECQLDVEDVKVTFNRIAIRLCGMTPWNGRLLVIKFESGVKATIIWCRRIGR